MRRMALTGSKQQFSSTFEDSTVTSGVTPSLMCSAMAARSVLCNTCRLLDSLKTILRNCMQSYYTLLIEGVATAYSCC